MTLRFGGLVVSDTNIKNQESFDYMLEAPQMMVFGEEAYPKIWLKIAIYMHTITCNHVFHDGNKRTALATALLFMEKNGIVLKEQVTVDELTAFAYYVASNCEINLQEIADWFKSNTNIIKATIPANYL